MFTCQKLIRDRRTADGRAVVVRVQRLTEHLHVLGELEIRLRKRGPARERQRGQRVRGEVLLHGGAARRRVGVDDEPRIQRARVVVDRRAVDVVTLNSEVPSLLKPSVVPAVTAPAGAPNAPK